MERVEAKIEITFFMNSPVIAEYCYDFAMMVPPLAVLPLAKRLEARYDYVLVIVISSFKIIYFFNIL